MARSESHSVALRAGRPTALAVVAGRALDMLKAGGDDVAQLVEVDGVLTGAVLRLARCPFYGPVAPQPLATASLSATTLRMGREVLADAIRGVAQDPAARDRAVIESECRRWVHAVAVAAAARWLSNQGEYEVPEEAYLAGIVHVHADPERPWTAEQISEQWRLGPRIAAVLESTHRASSAASSVDAPEAPPEDDATRRLVAVVHRGDAIAESLGFGERPLREGAAPPPEGGAAASVEEAIVLELAHAAALLRLPTHPAHELARRMAAEEVRRREALAAAPAHASAKSLTRLTDAHQAIVDLRPAGGAVGEVVERGLQVIHELLEFDRVLLLEPDAEREGTLRTKQVLCRTRNANARPVATEVPAPPESALARAGEAEGVLHSEFEGPDAVAASLLGSDGFLVMPLRAGTARLGVVVADHFVRRADPSAADASALAMAVGTLGLVLENVALHSEGKTLRSLAEKDELTGISNRRNILDLLRREVDRARRYGKPLALALVDVDHFKSWNDLHGHAVGDMVLQSVAQIITSASREIDSYGRYGGEEFLIVLPETSAEHAIVYAERLRTMIESHGAELATLYPASSLSVSIGVTQLLPRGDDAYQMIQRSDSALYAAKKHGRNRVCVELSQQLEKVPAPPRSRGVLDEL